MNNNKAPHILNTSSNLLGFCLIILTSIKISKFNQATFIDDLTGAAAILLMMSCIFSYLSMKTMSDTRSERLENAADIVFLIALVLISLTIIFVSFNLIA